MTARLYGRMVRVLGWAVRSLVLPVAAFSLIIWDAWYLKILFERMPDNDFGKGFYSTLAFRQGGDMYGLNPSIPARFEGADLNLWNLNPPHFHLLLLPLTPLAPRIALAAWCLLNAACLLAALRCISRELDLRWTVPQRQLALLGALGFVGTNSALLCGHISFLLFLLATLVWREARRGRWGRSGLLLGVGLSIKPFLLILLPYLLLRRRWRALATTGAGAGLCFALGLAVFGAENHRSWLGKFGDSEGWAWQCINGSLYGLLSRTLTRNTMCTPLATLAPGTIRLIWLGVGVPIGLWTLRVSAADETRAGLDRAFAILFTAALLLSPLGWTYYFWIPVGPFLAVCRSWWRPQETRSVSRPVAAAPSRFLVLAAVPGLVWPLFHAGIGQPSPWSTLLLGNCYSYCVLALWAALALDGLPRRQPPSPTFLAEVTG